MYTTIDTGQDVVFSYDYNGADVTFGGKVLEVDKENDSFTLEMGGETDQLQLSKITDVFMISL
ncbi:MAG: hypothetical protein V3T88_08640 [Nitrosomonadaceae bacterium]